MQKSSPLDYNEVRKIAITAVFADDYFFERVVLKGGNALTLGLGIAGRTSLDLDFSIENDFEDVEKAKERLRMTLERRFATVGLVVFDFVFGPRPFHPRDEELRWGGYVAEFKLMEKLRFDHISQGRERSRQSLVIGPEQQRKFKIELSKFEYTKGKLTREIDDFTIYVYAPEMIAIEKLRAICQQMIEYKLNKTPSPRARDFFDIYRIIDTTKTVLTSAENKDLLRHIFKAKEVPLDLLKLIRDQREFHRPDWDSVKLTAEAASLKDFDYYFDFVVDQVALLEPLGNMKAPL